jgi:hypothetical protein
MQYWKDVLYIGYMVYRDEGIRSSAAGWRRYSGIDEAISRTNVTGLLVSLD